jgi:enterochelin esterase-like enzyme
MRRRSSVSRLHALCSLLIAAALSVPVAAQTRTVTIASTILGEKRVLHVNLPPNYAVSRRRYEVIYLLDGHVRQFVDVTVAAAGYDIVGDVHDYAMPPQIVVGIDQRDRGTDLARNQELFTRFLTDEVVPFIDRSYRTSRYRTLIGHSLGGRFALMTFCRAPGVFPAVIAISAAGGDSTSGNAVTQCLASAFAMNGTTLRQLVLSAGDREERTHAGVERLRDFLRANAPPHWRWTVIDGTGLGHTDTPLATIPPGLRFVHDKTVWEMPPPLADSIANGGLDPERAIPAFFSALSTRVGVTTAPTLKWMLAEAHLRMRQPDREAAERSVRRLIDAYPEDLEGYGLRADLALRVGDTTTARQTLGDALHMLGRLDGYDVYDVERKRTLIETALAALRR